MREPPKTLPGPFGPWLQVPDFGRAAAEMVLIRLCHLADMPTPGDLVRQLTAPGGDAPAPGPAPGATSN